MAGWGGGVGGDCNVVTHMSVALIYYTVQQQCLINAVNLATADKADRLHKVESFITYFKSRCQATTSFPGPLPWLGGPSQGKGPGNEVGQARIWLWMNIWLTLGVGLVYDSMSKISPPKWGIKLWVLA